MGETDSLRVVQAIDSGAYNVVHGYEHRRCSMELPELPNIRLKLKRPEDRQQAWELQGPNKVIRRRDGKLYFIQQYRVEDDVVTLNPNAAQTDDITDVDW